MNHCPITYEICEAGKYSPGGLKKLSTKLRSLKDFPFSAEDQVREAIARAAKMSIMKKNELKIDDFLVYFAKERLELTPKKIEQTLDRYRRRIQQMD